MKHDGNLDVKGGLVVAGGQIGGGAFTLNRFEPYPLLSTGTTFHAFQLSSSGAVSLMPFQLPAYANVAYMGVFCSGSVIVPGTSQMTQEHKYMFGIYTQQTGSNSSLLSVLTSHSFSMRWEISGTSNYRITQPTSTHPNVYSYGQSSTTNGNAITSNYTGLKIIQVPINSVMTPGQYWVGMMHTRLTTGFSSGFRLSLLANLSPSLSIAPLGSLSSANTTGTRVSDPMFQPRVALGHYAPAGNVALPDQITMSSMTAGGASVAGVPHIVLWSSGSQ